MRPLTLAMLALAALAPAAAGLTVAQLIELRRAGVAEATLQAQIEATGTTYRLDAAQLKALQQAGLSAEFVQWMIRSGAPAAQRKDELQRRIDALQEQLHRLRDRPSYSPSTYYYYSGPYYPAYYGYSGFGHGHFGHGGFSPGFHFSRDNFSLSFGTHFHR